MELTPEQEQKAEAFKCWMLKKPFQYRHPAFDWKNWAYGNMNPQWAEDLQYRPTPLPTLRPWTRDEVPLGAEVRCKDSMGRHIITSVHAVRDEVYISEHGYIPFKTMLENLTLANGSPCGIQELTHKPHNADGLTPKQVVDGWRLLDQDEKAEQNTPPLREIEAWCSGEWSNIKWAGDAARITYRTRLTRAELAAKRKEAQE